MKEIPELSKNAQDILDFMVGAGQHIYIPKQTVENQWSPESKKAIEELLQNNLIEEIVTYRLVSK